MLSSNCQIPCHRLSVPTCTSGLCRWEVINQRQHVMLFVYWHLSTHPWGSISSTFHRWVFHFNKGTVDILNLSPFHPAITIRYGTVCRAVHWCELLYNSLGEGKPTVLEPVCFHEVRHVQNSGCHWFLPCMDLLTCWYNQNASLLQRICYRTDVRACEVSCSPAQIRLCLHWVWISQSIWHIQAQCSVTQLT